MRAYVGADWSATELVCAVARENGPPQRIRGPSPTLASVKDFVERVADREQVDEVHILLEAGNALWVRLLDAAGAVVYVVDGKQARRFGESLSSSGAKSDRGDAAVLARMAQSEAHRGQRWQAEDIERLRRLESMRAQNDKTITSSTQRLRALLRETMPTVDGKIRSLDTQWARRVLELAPTPWHAEQLSEQELAEAMRGTSSKTKQQVLDAYAASESPWLDEVEAELLAMHVRQLLAELTLALEQRTAILRQLDKVGRTFASRDILESADGVGLLQASSLLVYAFGDRVPEHRDAAAIALGACPVYRGSGTKASGAAKGHARMRKSVPPRARKTTYLLGRLATLHMRWAKAMYADGLRRGKKSACCYRRVARSFLRILTAMVRNQEPYDEDRYIAALKKNGVSWAMEL